MSIIGGNFTFSAGGQFGRASAGASAGEQLGCQLGPSLVVSWGGQLGPLLASVRGPSTSRDSGTCKIQSVLRGLLLVCPFLRGFHFWEGTHCNGLNLGREG